MVVESWRDGFGRVFRARAVLAGVFVVTLLAALPLAIAMRGMIEAHLGRSLAAHQVADAVDYDWWQEFTAQTSGLGTALTPSVIGFAATLDNISSVLDGQREQVLVGGALAVYVLLWLFLSGGIIDRYARQRPTRAYGFFAAAGGYFWRLLRLGMVAGVVYWLLFTYVHAWLFDDLYTRLTRDLSVERAAFAWRAALYAVFGALVIAVNLIVDYAKVRMVVEDRLSAIGALLASLSFILRNPGRALGLYALNAIVFLALLGVWSVMAPGAGRAGGWMWAAFALGQLYVGARLVLKLHFLASQTALFQRSLAHATYTAAPHPVWPHSAAIEALSDR